MASSTAERMNVQGVMDLSVSSTNDPFDRICARCGGLLVRHICMDLYSTGSDLEITARRCVQCGDVVDSVILRNRRIRQASSITHQTETTIFSPEIHIAV